MEGGSEGETCAEHDQSQNSVNFMPGKEQLQVSN